MKEETVYFDNIAIVYYIGTNAEDNFAVIDKGGPDDYWFHAKDVSSCHVVVKISDDIDIRTIIKRGALICKQNTNKLRMLDDVEIMYTKVKNVVKTDVPGLVNITGKAKIIIC